MMISEARRAPKHFMHRLPVVAIRYQRLRSAIEMTLMAAAAAAAVLLFAPVDWRIPSLIAICILAILAICIELPFLDRIRIMNTSYEFDRDFVRIRRGAILRREVALPASKIVSVTISQGPLQRTFDLATVRFLSVIHVEPLGPVAFDQALLIQQELQREESDAQR